MSKSVTHFPLGNRTIHIILSSLSFIAFSLILAPKPAHATFPGYNGQLVVTRSHSSFEGRTRSNIGINLDGTGLVNYTSVFGSPNTQKLVAAADGAGVLGLWGYADLANTIWHPWPTLPTTVSFDFTACPNQRFYFRSPGVNNDGWYIYSMKFDGSDVRQVAQVNAHGMSCSPDGTKISFVDWPSDAGNYGNDLYTINIDGTGLTQLTTGQHLHIDGAAPSWSPDGKTIAFTVNPGSPVDQSLTGIWTVDVATKQQTRLYASTIVLSRPIYSPDGSTIVFYNSNAPYDNVATNGGLELMNADGSNVHPFVINSTEPYTGGPAFATAWLSIPNQPPVVHAATVTTAKNTPVTIDVFSSATDEQALSPTNLSIAVNPAHGAAAINPATGTITYTPAANYTGSDALTFRLCDSFLLDQKCSTTTISITIPSPSVTPTPPSSTSIPPSINLASIGTVTTISNQMVYYYTGHKPTFSGTATVGASVTITIHSEPIILTTTADSSGNWSVTPNQDIPNGSHTVIVSATKNNQTTTLATYTLNINTGLANTGSPLWPESLAGALVAITGQQYLKRLKLRKKMQ